MSNYLYKLLLISIFSATTLYAQDYCAIPPSPYPFTEVQPDGTTITLRLNGHEKNYWKETLDGYTVIENRNGVYEFATKMGERLVPSGFKARPAEERFEGLVPGGIQKHLQPPINHVDHTFLQKSSTNQIDHTNLRTLTSNNFLNDTIYVLVTLIEYPDYRHRFSKEDFDIYFNGEGGQYPSVRDYYKEVSNNALIPKFVLTDWIMAKNNLAYYGMVNGKTHELVFEGIEGAVNQGVDFTRFDRNFDGIMDGLTMLHSGPGAEETGDSKYIWSHMSRNFNGSVGSIRIDKYFTIPEIRNNYGRNGMVGIGVTCHEFGHLLNLPDLYDTGTGGAGIGDWGVMGTGAWAGRENYPTHMSAWAKEKMDWVVTEDITSKKGKVKLLPVVDDYTVYRINTPNPDEYFLLENRKKSKLDNAIPGSGLLVWHINNQKAKTLDEGAGNNVNTRGDRGVDVEEADGTDIDQYRNPMSSNLFKWGQSFSVNTSPNTGYSRFSEVYGVESGVRIEDINLIGDTIVFDYETRTPGQGESCNNPVLAIEGKNESILPETWYSFTMPDDGTIYLNTEPSETNFRLLLYDECGDEVVQTILDTSPIERKESQTNFLQKDQTIYINTRNRVLNDDNVDDILTWNLYVESGAVAEQDSLALVAYYNNMRGEDWEDHRSTNWLETKLAAWEGVTVKNNRVINLNILGVGGTVPAEFFNLTALEGLSIYNESTEEEDSGIFFPSGINQLSKLKRLYLTLPSMEIDFMSQLGSLHDLEILSLFASKINHPLPQNLEELTKLKSIQIISQDWETTIPESFTALKQITTAYITGQLNGVIPENIGNMDSLNQLSLSGGLTGTIPESIGRLNNLTYLSLSNNSLSGEIPAEVFNLPNLNILDLSFNSFDQLPNNFLQNPNIVSIQINNNNISATLPPEVNMVTDPYGLNLSHNNFSGTLPSWVENIEWSYFNIGYNSFEGEIPQLMFSSNEGQLFFNNNKFSSLVEYDEGFADDGFAIMCANNLLSFDDLIKNRTYLNNYQLFNDDVGLYEPFGTYEAFSPQDTVDLHIHEVVDLGETYRIDLDIDATIEGNRYYWFKDGEAIETTTTNFLDIVDFDSTKAGSYRVEIKHENDDFFSALTLYYEGIEIQTGGKQNQVFTFEMIEDKTYGDAPFNLNITAQAEGDIRYSVSQGQNLITLENNRVSILGAGEVEIKITHPGDTVYNPADTVIGFTIGRASQQITFTNPEDKVVGDPEFTLNVQSSSGLPVSLNLVSGNVELENRKVRILQAGEVVINAVQSGNTNYLPANPVTIRFNVERLNQQIAFDAIEDRIYGDPEIIPIVSSNSKLPVTLTAITDNIEITTGNRIRILGAGNASVRATQEGDSQYNSAQAIVRTFEIAKAPQAIRLDTIPNKKIGDDNFIVRPVSNAGLNVQLSAIEGGQHIQMTAVDNGYLISILSAGYVVLEAKQEGNNNYEAAETVQEDFNIIDESVPEKIPQFITWENIPETLGIGDEITLRASTNSGLLPTFRVTGPATLTQDSILTINNTGVVTIIATQAGNEVYLPADRIQRTIIVTKERQIITFNPVPSIIFFDQTITLTATSSTGNPVLFRITQGPASIDGSNVVSFTGTGYVTIEAFVNETTQYAAASTRQVFWVRGRDGVGEEPIDPDEERVEQIITYNSGLDNAVFIYGDDPVDLSLENSSGLPVEVTVIDAEYVDGKIMITKPGEVTITITQNGNDEYLPKKVMISFIVEKAEQTILFTLSEIEQLTDSTYLLKAVSNRGLPVNYRVIEGDASIEDELLTVHQSDDLEIEAYNMGDEYYKGTTITQTLKVDLVTSISEELSKLYKIYPNPTESYLRIEMQNQDLEITHCRIIDYRGRLINEWKVNTRADLEIDMNTLRTGAYILELVSNDETIRAQVLKR